MNAWIQVSGWTIVHFVWQGALLGAATAVGLHLYRRRSARARYAIACAGLAAMLALPVVTAAVLARSARASGSQTNTFSGIPRALDLGFAEPATTTEQPMFSARPVRTALIDPALPYVVWTWVAGVLLLLTRFCLGWWRIRGLRSDAEVGALSSWQAAAGRLAERLRITAAFRVVESSLVHAPTVVGWTRPVILLPLAALTNLTPRQIEALLAHELAHIKRRDYLVNLLQTVAEALLFFHPCVWWVSSRIRQEREQCCDDVAVALCGEPVEYAEALLELASWRNVNAAVSLGANDGSLLARVRRLLGVPVDERRPLSAMVAVAAILIAAGAALSGPAPARAGSLGAQPSGEGRAVRHTDHFEIQHDVSLDLHAERVARDAERAFDQVSTNLRHNLAFRVPVILFRTTGDLTASVSTGASGAIHAGSFADRSRDRILLALDQPPDQWFGTLVHEVTHVFVFDILPDRATAAWVAEGLADYERGAWDPDDLVALRQVVRANAIPRLNDLQERGARTGSRLVHAVGHAAFDFMEARWGKAGIRQFLMALRQRAQNQADPFETAFGTRQDEFEVAFGQYLRQRLAGQGAPAAGENTETSTTLRLEGTVMSLRSPVHAGLACLELWVRSPSGAEQRWALECGHPTPQRLIEVLRPGDRVSVSGAPRAAATRRLRLDSLVRPADGFTWQRRAG